MKNSFTKFSFIFILVSLFLFGLCFMSCGNESWGMGNYNFTHIHFSNSIENHCATVEKWHDNEIGIEVSTKEYGPIYLSEGTYFLFRHIEDCPFCNEIG